MPYPETIDPSKHIAVGVALGRIAGISAINKFGCAGSVGLNVKSDLWDGADGVISTAIWIAPTQARVHNIVSTNAADDGAPVGTGMRTLRVYGLIDWDTPEVSEDITLDGTTTVATVNSYVIIHRMEGLTFGSGGTNAGVITATAVTDATITAAIVAGRGQTEMCIYGVPSTHSLALVSIMETVLRSAGSSVKLDADLQIKERADQADSGFITKEVFQFNDVAALHRIYGAYKLCTGPCIVKLQVTSDKASASVTGAFDGYLVQK